MIKTSLVTNPRPQQYEITQKRVKCMFILNVEKRKTEVIRAKEERYISRFQLMRCCSAEY